MNHLLPWALFILITLTSQTLAGCTTPEVNKCTFICPPGAEIPVGCYCIEDEIDKEAALPQCGKGTKKKTCLAD